MARAGAHFDWTKRGDEVATWAEQDITRHGPTRWRDRCADRFGLTPIAVTFGLSRRNDWTARRNAAAKKYVPVQHAPDDPILRNLERRVAVLTGEKRTLERKLAEADRDRTVVDDLAAVIRDETQAIPYVASPRRVSPPGASVADLVVCLTDEHSDEVIQAATTWGLEQYDFNIFRCRLARWHDIVKGYATRWLPGHRFERLWVFKLGDAVHGDIHDHKYRNFFGNSLRAALAVGDAEAQAIAALEPYFPGGVHVIAVSGNHPRQTRKKDYDDPHDNLDFLVATQIATRLGEHARAGRVTVHAPRAWTAFVEVQGHVCALNHGDDVQSTWGIPWYGFSRKENRVQSLVAQKDVRIEFFFYGHFHTDIGVTQNDARGVHSGAFTLTDGYAVNKVSSGNEPQQTLLAIDAPFGRILEIPIFLRDPAVEDAYRRGRYAPPFGEESILDTVAGPDRLAGKGRFPLIKAQPVK